MASFLWQDLRRAIQESIQESVNGAKRIRTADPLNAIEMRYQLRYSPLVRSLSSLDSYPSSSERLKFLEFSG